MNSSQLWQNEHLAGIIATIQLSQNLNYGNFHGLVQYYNYATPSGQLLPPRNSSEYFIYYEGTGYASDNVYIVSKKIYI